MNSKKSKKRPCLGFGEEKEEWNCLAKEKIRSCLEKRYKPSFSRIERSNRTLDSLAEVYFSRENRVVSIV